MAIEYNVSQDGMLIETYPKGILNIQKTIDYFDRLNDDSSIRQGAIEIVYFKNVTDFQISYSESESITKKYMTSNCTQKISKTIFVCETALAYGIGRMLQTLHEISNPDHKVEVVRSESEIEKVKVQS